VTTIPAHDLVAAIGELLVAAEDFAERARAQEVCRDLSRPGTGRHHQHAHSATLWRMAERTLRDRVVELSTGDALAPALSAGVTTARIPLVP
jgi:hypothetical protein